MAEDSMSIGEYLSQSREARRLSIAEVSQELHIRAEYLEALEQNHWDKLPGEVYGQGFLRSYARYLNLDAEALVGYRKRLREREAPPVAAPRPSVHPEAPVVTRRVRRARAEAPRAPSASRRRPSNVSAGMTTPLSSGRIVAGAAFILVVLFVVGLYMLPKSGNHPVTAPAAKSAAPSAPRSHARKKAHPAKHPSHSAKPASTVALVASNTGAGTASYRVNGSSVRITVSFTGQCWVEVWQNGVTKNPYGVVYNAGQSLTIAASSSVAVKLGTRAAAILVNQQSVALPDAPTFPLLLTFQKG